MCAKKCSWIENKDNYWKSTCELAGVRILGYIAYNKSSKLKDMKKFYNCCPTCKRAINFIPVDLSATG